MGQVIMSWGEATIHDGVSTETKNMPSAEAMSSPGVISDKTSTLESSEGDALTAKATGGVVVAEEKAEGGFLLKTRVKEPAFTLLERFGLGSIEAESGDFLVKTHVVSGFRAVEMSPKNVGAIGIRAPYCSLIFAPGSSEEEGYFVDLTYKILPVLNSEFKVDCWYRLFRKKGDLVLTANTVSFTSEADATGETVTATSTGDVTASSSQSWCTVTTSAKIATIKVAENTSASPRTAYVTIYADNIKSIVVVTQAGATE